VLFWLHIVGYNCSLRVCYHIAMIVLVILCLLASPALSDFIIMYTYSNGSNLEILHSSCSFNGASLTGTLQWSDNTCNGSTIPTLKLSLDNGCTYCKNITNQTNTSYNPSMINCSNTQCLANDTILFIHRKLTNLATKNGPITITLWSPYLLILLAIVPICMCLCGEIICCCCIYRKRKRTSHQQNEPQRLHQYAVIPTINVGPPGNDERRPIVAGHQPQPSRINTAVRQRLSNLSNSHGETQKPLNKVIVDDFLNKSLSISGKHFLCVICQHEVLKDELIMELECKHSFHVDCIREWLTKYHSTCPVCRHAVRPRR
jgi:hypothetical protein